MFHTLFAAVEIFLTMLVVDFFQFVQKLIHTFTFCLTYKQISNNTEQIVSCSLGEDHMPFYVTSNDRVLQGGFISSDIIADELKMMKEASLI